MQCLVIYAFFFPVWIVVTVSAIVVLAWLTQKEEGTKHGQKIDDFLVLATCQSGTSVMFSNKVNCPVVHEHT